MSWHYDAEIKVKKLETQPYSANCYIIACPRSSEAVIIDTPTEADRILAEAEGLKVKYIIITHTHADHLGAFEEVRQKLKAQVAVHPSEAANLPSPPDLTMDDRATISFGTVKATVLHTPGHSLGSLCLHLGKHLFSGDTLFPGGPGHTRSPAAFEQIVKSITAKLFVLPDDTKVYPGHGADTILGTEKQAFAAFSQRQHAPGLCGDVLWLSS